MKFNWGTGLVIGMLTFIAFIMYFVVTMMSSSDYDHDLVVEDYYRAELHYQNDIDAEKNALALEHSIELERTGAKLMLNFPENMDLSTTEGIVVFYRPSNKKLDFSIPFSEIRGQQLIIPDVQLVKGRWNISVGWQQGGKDFLYKREILY